MTTHYIQSLGVAKCREIVGMTYKNAFISFDDGPLIAVDDIKKELDQYDTDDFMHLANHISPNTVVVG